MSSAFITYLWLMSIIIGTPLIALTIHRFFWAFFDVDLLDGYFKVVNRVFK